MKKVMVLILSLALGLFLGLTMGCQKKPGEEQNKAGEKAAEIKNTADEKAAEIRNTANEKAAEVRNTTDEKAAEVRNRANEKAAEVHAKAAEVNAKVAGWDACKGCHTDEGKPAPSKASLLVKFKTEKEFIAAAKRSQNSMMNNFKKDDLLKRAAKDLGLQ